MLNTITAMKISPAGHHNDRRVENVGQLGIDPVGYRHTAAYVNGVHAGHPAPYFIFGQRLDNRVADGHEPGLGRPHDERGGDGEFAGIRDRQ